MGRILIIEDDLDLTTIWRDALTDEGHDVEVCHEGHSGGHLIETQQFDLIIADVNIPGHGGYYITGLAKLFQKKPNILVVSGKADAFASLDIFDLTRKLGAVKTLEKPIPIPILRHIVCEMLKARDA